MRLLVTGGSGFVGAGVLRRAPNDWQMAATYLAHPIEQAGVAAFCVDVRDANALSRLFDDVRPEVVIHTAALMTGDQMMSVNADGSRNIARATKQIGARLIHLSSDVIFDGEHAPYDESALPHPITPYAESKARAEQFMREENPSTLIVRTSLVYGFAPMDPRTRQTLDGKMPFLFTDEYRCPIFVDDLADALIELALSFRAAQRREISVINIAGAQRVSRYEFGVKLARAFGVEPRVEPALSASFSMPRPRDCALDISLAQKMVQTKLRGVDQVISQIGRLP